MNIGVGHSALLAEKKAHIETARLERACPPEMAWLCALNPAEDGVRERMKAALAEVIMTMPTPDVERIVSLAETGEPAAALRLTARLARVHRMLSRQRQRDLAACALLLAVLEYRDERAAIELAVLTELRADQAADRLLDATTYPPPLDQPARLRARLRSRGRLAISLIASRTGWGHAVSELGMMAQGDPLTGYGSSGRPVSGWSSR